MTLFVLFMLKRGFVLAVSKFKHFKVLTGANVNSILTRVLVAVGETTISISLCKSSLNKALEQFKSFKSIYF